MTLSLAILIAVGIHPTPARTAFDPLCAAMQLHAIDSAPRQAAFLSECAVESAMFTAMEEDMTYRRPDHLRDTFRTEIHSLDEAMHYVNAPEKLANRVYANRMGNGDEASGDGWNFRGSGYMGLTGRDNFSRCSADTGRPYLANPKLLRTSPSDAAISAAWFWTDKHLNLLADGSLIDLITAKINPAMEAAPLRRQLFNDFMRQFTKGPTPTNGVPA